MILILYKHDSVDNLLHSKELVQPFYLIVNPNKDSDRITEIIVANMGLVGRVLYLMTTSLLVGILKAECWLDDINISRHHIDSIMEEVTQEIEDQGLICQVTGLRELRDVMTETCDNCSLLKEERQTKCVDLISTAVYDMPNFTAITDRNMTERYSTTLGNFRKTFLELTGHCLYSREGNDSRFTLVGRRGDCDDINLFLASIAEYTHLISDMLRHLEDSGECDEEEKKELKKYCREKRKAEKQEKQALRKQKKERQREKKRARRLREKERKKKERKQSVKAKDMI